MKIYWVKCIWIPVLAAFLAGCAHYPVNAPKTVNVRDGYYLLGITSGKTIPMRSFS